MVTDYAKWDWPEGLVSGELISGGKAGIIQEIALIFKNLNWL